MRSRLCSRVPRIPIISNKVTLAMFGDAGATGALHRDQLNLDPSGLASLQQQFPSANVKGSLQIQPGTNFKLRS